MGHLAPAMTQEKLDNQRDVVKNERRWRVDNQPYGDWDERLQTMLYPHEHPYHHSVIGSMEDLDAASLQDVLDFFGTFYAPNNAVLTVCGDFDHGNARALIEKYFGPIPRGPAIPPMPGVSEVSAILGAAQRVVVEEEIPMPRVYVAFRIPPYGSPDFYAATVAAHVLTEGKGALLYRELVRTGIAQDAAAFAFPIVLGAAILAGWTTANPETTTEQLESALLAGIAELDAIAEKDVERATRLIASSRLIELQRVDQRADALSMFETLFKDPERINSELERIRAVTADDVRAFAKRFLGDDNRVLLIYVPRSDA
jgi:predicted Zn-dependent peptidase